VPIPDSSSINAAAKIINNGCFLSMLILNSIPVILIRNYIRIPLINLKKLIKILMYFNQGIKVRGTNFEQKKVRSI
jgi:hypothetical protein